jgi:hypothetical protein
MGWKKPLKQFGKRTTGDRLELMEETVGDHAKFRPVVEN